MKIRDKHPSFDSRSRFVLLGSEEKPVHTQCSELILFNSVLNDNEGWTVWNMAALDQGVRSSNDMIPLRTPTATSPTITYCQIHVLYDWVEDVFYN